LLNAAEASGREGAIRTSALVRDLNPADCLDFLGRVKPGRVVELAVEDGGEGICDALGRRLFRDLFFTTRTRKRGMGLAICYGLLSAHRGGIRFDTPPHGGTVVRIVLPVCSEGDFRGQCNR
jgi:signal transduction histidine kinase